ncbi:glycosyltransferase [Flavobacteriaceae bacterium TK19130]|nr:glycosyltransferase [Thermobacterium salinum]
MSKRIAIFGSSKFETIEYHIADSLKHLGHTVIVFDYNDAFSIHKKADYWLRRFNESFSRSIAKKIAEKVVAFKPDLVIATYRDIHPDFVATVKQETKGQVPCVHINPDALTTFQNQQLFASEYDHYFTKDPYIQSFMKDKMGISAHVLAESFNPRVHKAPNQPKVALEKEIGIDVLAFGSMYPYRTRMLQKLVDAGVKVKLYGSKGPFFPNSLSPFFTNKKILGDEKSRLIHGSKIVFNNFHYAEIQGVNCKFFELNGAGAFQICDRKEIIQQYVNYDAEAVTFESMNEAIEKINYYLKPSQNDERLAIAAKNASHFAEHHTYENRMKELFSIIGF